MLDRNVKWLQKLGVDTEQLLDQVALARYNGAVRHRTKGSIGHPTYGAVGNGTIDSVTGVAMTVPAYDKNPYLAVSIGAITLRMPQTRIARLWKSLETTVRRIAAIDLADV